MVLLLPNLCRIDFSWKNAVFYFTFSEKKLVPNNIFGFTAVMTSEDSFYWKCSLSS
jgi:hypothetical protein